MLALQATPRFIRDNTHNPNPLETRRQPGANSHPVTPTHTLITHPKLATPSSLKSLFRADLRKLRSLLPLFPLSPTLMLSLRHSTVPSLPRPLADKAPHARRVKAVVSKWCWKSPVAGVNWRTRARPSPRRDTIQPGARGRTPTVACCRSSAGRRVVTGALSPRSRVFWAKRVRDRLLVDDVHLRKDGLVKKFDFVRRPGPFPGKKTGQ